MSNGIDPFSFRWMENHRASIRAQQDQAKSYYRREEVSLSARYAAEMEQFKASTARDLAYLNHGHHLEVEDRRANLTREVEEKRGILARWVEEFRGRSAKEVEEIRQTGRTSLQEREHVHRRLLIELDQAEERVRADEAHAKQLVLVKKTDELATFQRQREAIYALEARRFDTILAERQAHTTQLLAEYASRNATGQSVVTATASMLAAGLQDNSKMNEMILAAVIAKKASEAAHRQELEKLNIRADHGLSEDIGRFIKDKGI